MNFVAGYGYQEFIDQGHSLSGGDFITDAFQYSNISAANEFNEGLGDVESFKTGSRLISVFTQSNLYWKDYLSLSLIFRQEGSSRSGENNKWGTFPSISGGLDINKWLKMPQLNYLNIRGGYGISGNILPESYLSHSIMRQNGRSYYNGEYVYRYDLLNSENKDLGHEIKKEANIGLDFMWLDNKMAGSVEYYANTINNLLLVNYQLPVPPNLANTTWVNAGQLKNSGIELKFKWKVIENDDFHYSAGFNLTGYLRNKIVSLSDKEKELEFGYKGEKFLPGPGPGSTVIMYHVKEEGPVGQMIGNIYLGTAENGQPIYKDVDGDDMITPQDRVPVGNGLPGSEIGFSNNLRYKNWELTFFSEVFLDMI